MKLSLSPKDIQKIYDLSLAQWKHGSHNALEPHQQMIYAVICSLGAVVHSKGHILDISVPERVLYQSIDDE